jgi:beta-N-acetylhexosaminidase
LLDLLHPGSHEVIGERALGDEPMQVAALGRALLEGLEAGGVCGIVKHLPGHGRAAADSHVELPVADAGEEALAVDLAPFRALHDAPMGMVAHILYPVWDADRPASLSPVVIGEIIRGAIGFTGLLMTDDIAMAALSGTPGERAAAALAAGCDLVLHCSGRLADNEVVAAAVHPIGELAQGRLDLAMAVAAGRRSARSYEALAAKRDALLAYA